MQNGTKKVSVIVPVYNVEKFIRETIACVQTQTYPHWELLLVEDGKIIYENYQRHFSQVRQKTLELLAEAAPFAGDRPLMAAISGSAGLGLAESAGVSFVQEVFATGEVVRRLEPDAAAVVEYSVRTGGERGATVAPRGGGGAGARRARAKLRD